MRLLDVKGQSTPVIASSEVTIVMHFRSAIHFREKRTFGVNGCPHLNWDRRPPRINLVLQRIGQFILLSRLKNNDEVLLFSGSNSIP